MLRAFKYRIYPTKEQEILMSKMFGCVRFVFNWTLNEIKTAYEKDKTHLKLSDREWTCPNCNSKLDRDLNAAINVKKVGLSIF